MFTLPLKEPSIKPFNQIGNMCCLRYTVKNNTKKKRTKGTINMMTTTIITLYALLIIRIIAYSNVYQTLYQNPNYPDYRNVPKPKKKYVMLTVIDVSILLVGLALIPQVTPKNVEDVRGVIMIATIIMMMTAIQGLYFYTKEAYKKEKRSES